MTTANQGGHSSLTEQKSGQGEDPGDGGTGTECWGE